MNIPGYATNPRRTRALMAIAALVIVGAIAYAIYWHVYLSHFEDTDDAYVQGNVVQVTPQVAGTVVQVNVQDTQQVVSGQLLVALDPSDAKAALDEAQATLAQTVREVRQVYGNDASEQADIRFREADVARANAELVQAEQDLARRRDLARRQLISREDLTHAEQSVAVARSAASAAASAVEGSRSQLAASRAITQGVDVSQHPKVAAAAARVREALIALDRTRLSAPVGGLVAKRSVQLGQRVAAGTPVLAIVPLDQVWVDANFKEVQLRSMRLGQPVKLTADVFGKDVEFHGSIAGFGAGTGAAFALIPAQNATGNWIKVVQRVPVRIALDAQELRQYPLRLGLSMKVEVDTAAKANPASAATLADQHAALPTTNVDAQADAMIRRIIADNLHQSTAVVANAR